MAKVQRVSKNEKIEIINDILRKDGCVVIENLISDQEIQSLRSDLYSRFAGVPDCRGDFYGYATKRMSSLFTKSDICQKMALDPTILGVMDEFMLKGCLEYQINLTQAIAIGPGEEAQIIHQDDSMLPFMHPDYEVMINCMWAVDDFTDENGATLLVPGSHLWPREKVIDPKHMRLPNKDEITKGTMKAGSVLIYFGSLYHAGGANATDKSRCGAVISYSLGWLRQAENNYLAYSKEEVKKFPSRLQRLLGYFVHAPNLGSVDGQDPIKLLEGGKNDGYFEEFIPEEAKAIIKDFKKSLKTAA